MALSSSRANAFKIKDIVIASKRAGKWGGAKQSHRHSGDCFGSHWPTQPRNDEKDLNAFVPCFVIKQAWRLPEAKDIKQEQEAFQQYKRVVYPFKN